MHKVFQKEILIRFSHCDPAGIVYHPQYFVLLNELMEDFWIERIGLSYKEQIQKREGFPVVGTHMDFCSPSVLGERCVMKCWVEAIGTSSIRFAMRIVHQRTQMVRLRGTETVVCVRSSKGGFETVRLAPDLRQKLQAYLASESLRLRS